MSASEPRRPFRILVPIDLSPGARPALAQAVALARAANGEVIALHVLDTSVAAEGPRRTWSEIVRAAAAMRRAAEEELRKEAARVDPEGQTVRPLVYEGRAAERIVDAAFLEKADLILIAAGRAGGLGSVADRVARVAPCDVLIVRGAARLEPAGAAADPPG